MEVVAVLGASSDPSRYSFKAMEMLKDYGHWPIPVHPRETHVLGTQVVASLAELVKKGQKVDTVTVYVNASISQKFEKDFIELDPKRVIFNPGAENRALVESLTRHGIQVLEACTLVLLRTGQY